MYSTQYILSYEFKERFRLMFLFRRIELTFFLMILVLFYVFF